MLYGILLLPLLTIAGFSSTRQEINQDSPTLHLISNRSNYHSISKLVFKLNPESRDKLIRIHTKPTREYTFQLHLEDYLIKYNASRFNIKCITAHSFYSETKIHIDTIKINLDCPSFVLEEFEFDLFHIGATRVDVIDYTDAFIDDLEVSTVLFNFIKNGDAQSFYNVYGYNLDYTDDIHQFLEAMEYLDKLTVSQLLEQVPKLDQNLVSKMKHAGDTRLITLLSDWYKTDMESLKKFVKLFVPRTAIKSEALRHFQILNTRWRVAKDL